MASLLQVGEPSLLMGIHFAMVEASVAGDDNISCAAFKSIRDLSSALKSFSTDAFSLLLLTMRLKLVLSL